MKIRKSYKFYAAHRNQEIDGKCWNIHGHRYGIDVVFDVVQSPGSSISILFEDFDAKVEPFLKNHYDHALLLDRADPLAPHLQRFGEEEGRELKIKWFDAPTSAENLAAVLFDEIDGMGFDVNRIEVKETDSSVVTYQAAPPF